METLKDIYLKVVSKLHLTANVVIAKEWEDVKECKVYLSSSRAWKEFDRLSDIYGYGNMAFFSRRIL